MRRASSGSSARRCTTRRIDGPFYSAMVDMDFDGESRTIAFIAQDRSVQQRRVDAAAPPRRGRTRRRVLEAQHRDRESDGHARRRRRRSRQQGESGAQHLAADRRDVQRRRAEHRHRVRARLFGRRDSARREQPDPVGARRRVQHDPAEGTRQHRAAAEPVVAGMREVRRPVAVRAVRAGQHRRRHRLRARRRRRQAREPAPGDRHRHRLDRGQHASSSSPRTRTSSITTGTTSSGI